MNTSRMDVNKDAVLLYYLGRIESPRQRGMIEHAIMEDREVRKWFEMVAPEHRAEALERQAEFDPMTIEELRQRCKRVIQD